MTKVVLIIISTFSNGYSGNNAITLTPMYSLETCTNAGEQIKKTIHSNYGRDFQYICVPQ